MIRVGVWALGALAAFVASAAFADRFGSGDLEFEIPFVPIGHPGNPADTSGAPNPAGAVDYHYRIGRYEVPEIAIRNANALSQRAGEPLGITLDQRGPQQPATRVSWFEAARFVNWLNADKGAPPAYKFAADGEFALWTPDDPGFHPGNHFRNARARYFLPSIDEWYKAAYYDPVAGVYWDYPTGSDEPPIAVASGTQAGTAVWNQPFGVADVTQAGGSSPNGTRGQGGNVLEWQETSLFAGPNVLLTPDVRGVRGGQAGLVSAAFPLSALGRDDLLASFATQVGFRVARVPEPSTMLLVASAFGFMASARISRS